MIKPEDITKLVKLVDLGQCLQCYTCESSCEGRHLHQRNVRNGVKIGHIIIPYACKQCEDPQCVKSCKKGASKKDPVSGAVYLDRELCIGCGLCAKKCPFGSISMEESGKFKERQDKDGSIKRSPLKFANRCDLCRDYKKCGCFFNCPGGALKKVPFNMVLQSLPVWHQEKLKSLFLNGHWIKEEEKKLMETVEAV